MNNKMIQDSEAVGPLIMIITIRMIPIGPLITFIMIMVVPDVFFSNDTDNDNDNDDSRWLNKAGVSSNVQCAWNP